MSRRPVTPTDALSTWEKLNAKMRICTEHEARFLLKLELRTKRRKMFLLRIHSRLNYLRAGRERIEIMEGHRAAS